jgi:3-hydroxyisobutyrate dehydrogenase-like beta-hydroxyacid dehydrogenase
VSGGEPGGSGTEAARLKTLTFIVGGEKAAFDRALSIFAMLGKRYFYLGPAGSGSTVKIISNFISGLTNLVVSEAFVLGAAAGVDFEALLTVFDGTDAKSYWLFEYFGRRLRERDFDPGFSVDLMHKDHVLMQRLGQRCRVPLLLNHAALHVYELMQAQGLGRKDLVEAVNFLGALAKVDVLDTLDTARPVEGGVL